VSRPMPKTASSHSKMKATQSTEEPPSITPAPTSGSDPLGVGLL
jgi:hypothetical protein